MTEREVAVVLYPPATTVVAAPINPPIKKGPARANAGAVDHQEQPR